MSDDTGKRFTDEEARAILARAIEIESRAPLTSMDDLRAIAADAKRVRGSIGDPLRRGVVRDAPPTAQLLSV